MRTIANAIAAAIALCIVGTVAYIVVRVTDALVAFVEATLTGLLYFGAVLLFVVLAGVVIVGVLYVRKRWMVHWRQEDGSYGVREFRLNRATKMLVNMDRTPGPGVIVSKQYGLVQLPPADGLTWAQQLAHAHDVEVTRRINAATPGDRALVEIGDARAAGGIKYAAHAKLLAGAYDKPHRTEAPAVIEAEPERPPMSLDQALQLTDERSAETPGGNIVLGYNQTEGKLCRWTPIEHQGIAVAGGPGTGKTMGSGYLLVLAALRLGYHVTILDPKGGVDFGWMGKWCEHQETDSQRIVGQIEQLHNEHERRIAMLRSAGANELADAPGIAPRTLVLVEEFGALAESVEMTDKATYSNMMLKFGNLLRLSRASGLHFAILDQDATKWSSVIMSNTRRRLAYATSMQAAAKLKEYEADAIEERGVFVCRRREYRGWDVKPAMREYMSALPAMQTPPLLTGPVRPDRTPNATTERHRTPPPEVANTERTERTPKNGATPPPPVAPFDVRSHPVRDAVEWYMETVGGTQAECRRWFAEHGRRVARGYVSDIYNGNVGGDDGPPLATQGAD